MAVSPTGILSTPLDSLAELVASSTSFQTWVGALDATAAKAKVYRTARDQSGASAWARPFALATIPSGWNLTDALQQYATGSMHLLFEDDVDSANAGSHEDAAYEFTNNVGAVIKEMIRNASSPGYLYVSGIEIVSGAQRACVEEGSDYYQIWFRVAYGLKA